MTLAGADEEFVKNIAGFAQLHDIGKIKVAEIIRRPRELTRDEFEIVKKHPFTGGKMVKGLEDLEVAYDIIMDHHEKWDGSGYPRGKKGEEISLAGRIVGLVDVFEALVSARPYKNHMTTTRPEQSFPGVTVELCRNILIRICYRSFFNITSALCRYTGK